MPQSIVVTDRLPAPAQTLLGALQSLAGMKRSEAERLIRLGVVEVSGIVRTQGHWRVAPGDRIQWEPVPAPPPVAAPSSTREPVEILFEDDAIWVLAKPAAMLTVPTTWGESNTLQGWATKRLQRQVPGGKACCVQRLDRGVSGVLVMAKSLAVAQQLRTQFAARKPKRRYIAIVLGNPQQQRGTVQSYMATDAQLNRYSVQDPSQGELAITHYQVQFQLQDAAMIQVELETGRRNQIRVHMADLGHPVLGDPRYGRNFPPHPQWVWDRMGLQAYALRFNLPVTGEEMDFDLPWPEPFRVFKRKATPASETARGGRRSPASRKPQDSGRDDG
ncbi:MAG: RluA family pseudouridine synthase [Pirellulaceae bacterium]